MFTILGRILAALFFGPLLLIPFFFYGSGCYMCWRQDYRIDHFLPISALVKSAGVKVTHSTGKNASTNYTPEITYEYDVAGKHFISSDILPAGKISSDSAWAYAIVRPFKAGARSTAYYDPADPSVAFIARQYDFFPLSIMLFSASFVLIFPVLIGGAMLSTWFAAAPKATPDGWFAIPPTTTIRRLLRWGIAASVFWYLPATIALLDFYSRVHHGPTWSQWIAIAIYMLIGLLPLGLAVREWKISRYIGTPRLRTNALEAQIGQTIDIEVQQDFNQFGHREVMVKLQCQFQRQGKNATTETISEHEQPAKAMTGQSPGTASERLTLQIPPEANHSTNLRGGRGYSWRIAVVTKVENLAKEQTTYFPLMVRAVGK